MALTFTKLDEDVWGKTRVKFFDVVPAASDYPTGGYAITAALTGMRTVFDVRVIGGNAAMGQVKPEWDAVNGKLKLWYPTGGGSAPAALGAPTVIPAAGATPVASTAAQPSFPFIAGSGLEVGSLTDVSSLSFRIMVLGN